MVKYYTPKSAAMFALLISLAITVSCAGNSKSITPSSTPNIAGPWEFVAISQTSAGIGVVTGIEVALSEGQVLENGLNLPDGNITANSNQISFVSLAPNSLNITDFGGPCQSTPGDSSLTGTVTSTDATVQFTFTENGNVFKVTATLSGDGKSLNGTYVPDTSSGTINTCTADSGGSITGNMVGKITGNFSGQICALGESSSSCEPNDTATATASENSSNILTLNLTLTGVDNTALTLTGPVTGNSFTLQGTVKGQIVTYYGYYETVNNVLSIYLADATNPASPNYVGTLTIPH
jgi:hypothetical protein